jgi:pyrroline-5-carboxylate reductase
MTDTQKSIILVGCGNMGRAMLESWVACECVKPENIHVVEPAEALRNKLTTFGVSIYSSADALPEGLKPVLFIMAVKPQVMFDVAPDYQKYIDGGAAVLSIAAGIGTKRFEKAYGASTAVVRVMPNTPAAVAKGMMVIYTNEFVTEQQSALVEELMQANGAFATIDDEALMDAVTAVSGSGPAYVFHVIEAMIEAGIAAGLPDETAKLLAEQTVYGAACYAKESGVDAKTLREQVTSPNGTTAAALAVLMKDDALKNLMRDAVAASKKRSEELG